MFVNEAATEQNMISYLEHERAFSFKCKMVQRDQHENQETNQLLHFLVLVLIQE